MNRAILPLTGERTVPGIPEENYWFRRHEAAYLFTAPYAGGATTLEVGCGEGYGTAVLAAHARRVLGIDYDALTVEHATRTYPQARFARANLAALPIADSSIDLVATLQVIEHVWDHGQFVRECRRVLRPGGTLLVTTPNRLTFSPGRDEPLNPFHTKEFTATELVELLTTNGFDAPVISGLHAGGRIDRLDRHYGTFVDAQLDQPPAQWSARLRADVVSVTTADFPIVPAEKRNIDESLDLVVIVRRS